MLLDRINSWLLCILLVLAPMEAQASQNALLSPTTGTVSGLQLTNNYNNALDSLNTCNSGATAPTNQLTGIASLGNCWLNTTSNPYPKQTYDGANWLTPYWIDVVNHMTDVKIGGGSTSLASASTDDLCGTSVAPMAYISITGTTTINSFGSTCNAGHVKIITFTGILTLTYNATSMIIPGAANIITAAGDQAVVISLGSGNWQIVAYTPASGAALINPSVDLGTVLFTFLTAPPSSKYLFAYGQAVSRTTYATFMTDTTITQSVTRTNGSPTLTGFSDTTQIPTGAPVEGSGIPTSTTISSCTSSTCTMSANASSSGTANVQIFPNGNGDGSTTFNLPNCQGVTLAGRDNMSGTPRAVLTSSYFGTNPDALGAFGGAQSKTLATANFPPYTPSGGLSGSVVASISNTLQVNSSGTLTPPGGGTTAVAVANSATGVQATGLLNGGGSTGAFVGNAQGGTSTPFSLVQPTLTANCMVRVLAMLDAPAAPNSFASNDNHQPVADRRRLVA